MNEYRFSVTQTIHHVVYAYGVDVAAAQESVLDGMNEHGRLLEGCEVDIVCEHQTPVYKNDAEWRAATGEEPFMYQVVPDPEDMPHEQE